jgi:SPASM domain peptide maturase of grasp-with-spasm system
MKYFKTFENCIISVGHKRSLISDLQFGISEFIPNSMAEIILRLNDDLPLDLLYEEFEIDDRKTIQEYINFLESKNFGQYFDDHDILRFTKINKTFYTPEEISNIVIEVGKESLENLHFFFAKDTSIFCKNLCVIFYESLEYEHFFYLKDITNNFNFHSVEIIVKYNEIINDEFINEISFEFTKLTKLHFHSAPVSKEVIWEGNSLINLIFSTNEIKNFKACGSVKSESFGTNIQKFTEAIDHNSCLHKKISIDCEGNIRNCPSMPQSFGNIKDTTLEEALNHIDFKKYWNLTKDKIEVCKDCEFRYICTDCRAYTERTHENEFGLDTSKPLKCGYNPYTGEWEEWSTNPLKQKAIKYYGMQELVKKN